MDNEAVVIGNPDISTVKMSMNDVLNIQYSYLLTRMSCFVHNLKDIQPSQTS